MDSLTRPIRVGLLPSEPNVQACYINKTLINAGLIKLADIIDVPGNAEEASVANTTYCRHPGVDVEIFTYFTHMLNISVQVVHNWTDYVKATDTEGSHKNYSKTLPIIAGGIVDTFISWYKMTPDRMEKFQFTMPIEYHRLQMGFIVSSHTQSFLKQTEDVVFVVFGARIWLTFFAAFVTCCIGMTTVLNFARWKKGEHIGGVGTLDFHGIWSTITVMVNQFSGEAATGSLSGNILAVSIGFFFFFFAATFKGLLVRELNYDIAKSTLVAFETTTELVDLVERGRRRVVFSTQNSDFYAELVKSSVLPVFVALRNALKQNPPVYVETQDDVLDAIVREPDLVYPGRSFLRAVYILRDKCDLMFVEGKEDFRMSNGFMFAKNSSFPAKFNALLSTAMPMIHGTEQKYIDIYTRERNKTCPPAVRYKGDPLSVDNLSGLFFLNMSLFSIGLGILIFEWFYWGTNRRRSLAPINSIKSFFMSGPLGWVGISRNPRPDPYDPGHKPEKIVDEKAASKTNWVLTNGKIQPMNGKVGGHKIQNGHTEWSMKYSEDSDFGVQNNYKKIN